MTDVNQTEEISNEAQAQEEEAFAAVFGADQAPTEEPTEETKEEPKEEPTEEPKEPEPEPTEPMTQERLREMLEEYRQKGIEAHTKLAGKVGELQQKLDRIAEAKSQYMKLGPKTRSNLESNFPELLEMFAEDDDPAPQAHYTPPEDKSESLEETKRTFERKFLTLAHKDWEDVVALDDFGHWKNTILDSKKAAELDSTWESEFVADRITEFKEWRDSQNKQKKQQQERLDSAITPRGIPRTGSPSHNDDDEESSMMKAFKSRR